MLIKVALMEGDDRGAAVWVNPAFIVGLIDTETGCRIVLSFDMDGRDIYTCFNAQAVAQLVYEAAHNL